MQFQGVDAIERKKSLRILAGIFLLIGIVIGLASVVFSYFVTSRGMAADFFRIYWITLVRDLILLLIAVFIFNRLFVVDGILEGILALWALLNIVSAVISLVKGAPKDLGAYYAGSAVNGLLNVAAAVLLMIGFFLHRRASKKLFVTAAILMMMNSVAGSILPYLTVNARYASAASILSSLGVSFFLFSFTFLAWIFMGLYFGAQKEAPDGPQPSFE